MARGQSWPDLGTRSGGVSNGPHGAFVLLLADFTVGRDSTRQTRILGDHGLSRKYVVGLTATPTRKDGHHPIIYMQCGPVRFSMSARTMTGTTPFEHQVTPRHTEFRMAPELECSSNPGV